MYNNTVCVSHILYLLNNLKEHDLRLWNGQAQMGNKWNRMEGNIFEGKWRYDQLKYRWYSQPFKIFIASKFGNGAYEEAHAEGRRLKVIWTEEDDAMLWKLHQEIGKKWSDMEDRYFKERGISEAQIKNRWYSQPFKNYAAKNFGPDAHQNAKHKRE